MSLTQLFIRRDHKATRRRPDRARYRPLLEGMEDRVVMNAPGSVATLLAPVHLAPRNQPVAVNVPLSITGINLTGITTLANGAVQATGTITGTLLNHAFQDVGFVATLVPTADPTCPILHLEINPIHLSLLGLNVDTSAICLDITATPGGGLLGNLLCGGSLGGILGGLTGGTLTPAAALTLINTDLNSALGDINTILSTATPGFGSPAVSSTPGLTSNILDLSLGPVNLSLLGLNVKLDNCNNGPITVKITATRGGGLLGDLLSSLGSVLGVKKPNPVAINNLLGQIVTLIESL